MVPISLLSTLRELMPTRPEREAFYAAPLHSPCAGFPPTAVFAGSEEIFYPLMPGLLRALRAANALRGFYPGDGLCHVYPYVPGSPDCHRALMQICELVAETSRR
jgi:acetyl esterase/lipase